MHIFMTGATGFVGLNIVEALLSAHHEVTCYVRPKVRHEHLSGLPVRCVTGELSDSSALGAAMRGAEGVIHTAGNTSCDRRDWPLLVDANIDSTRAIVAAAKAVGVRRIVYTSTTSTIGSCGKPDHAADETTPLKGFRSASPYARSKQAAEAILLSMPPQGPQCVVLNPAEVLGPYDHSLQWGRIVLAVATGRVPFIPPGSGTFSPARDVAQAHVAALTGARPAERYILGGHHIRFKDFFALIGEVVGREPIPETNKPYRWQRLQAGVQAHVQRWTGRPPPVDPYRMQVFGGHHLFDDGKARAELGYKPRALRTAIQECYDWYRTNGFLPNTSAAGLTGAA